MVNKHYQINKEKLQKELPEKYQNLFEEEKEKRRENVQDRRENLSDKEKKASVSS